MALDRRQFIAGATVLAAVSLPVSFTPAHAGEDAINAIIKSLAPIAGQEDAGGGVVEPAPGAAPSANDVISGGDLAVGAQPALRRERDDEGRVIYVVPRRKVDIEVYFPFDSADLTARSRADLDALGRALASPRLARARYLIAGHTDAKGDDAYNLRLSKARARAVRDYLVEAFPIDPWRLHSVGFGEERLKRPDNPYAAINRRVEVVLISRID